jgi:hypothetical protein
MGFGHCGKECRLRGGGFLGDLFKKVGGVAGQVIGAVKSFVPIAAEVLDRVKPGAGTILNTGFNVADGLASKLKGGETKPASSRVDSVLRNPIVPKRAPVYTPSDSESEEDVEY